MKLTKPHHKSHDFTGHLHYGIVKEVDPEKYKVRCTIPLLDDLLTFWLPVMSLCSFQNTFYSLPKKGAMVFLLLDARAEEGVVLGSLYNEKDPVAQTDPEITHLRFKNGTVIMHDETTGNIHIETKGTVSLNAKQVDAVVSETVSLKANQIEAVVGQSVEISAVTVNVNATDATIAARTTITGDTTITGVTTLNGAVTVAGALSASSMSTPSLSVAGKDFTAHTHAGVTTGTGSTLPPS